MFAVPTTAPEELTESLYQKLLEKYVANKKSGHFQDDAAALADALVKAAGIQVDQNEADVRPWLDEEKTRKKLNHMACVLKLSEDQAHKFCKYYNESFPTEVNANIHKADNNVAFIVMNADFIDRIKNAPMVIRCGSFNL